MQIFLGLGSNLGDREENLRRAIELLAREIEVTKRSSVYETAPLYLKEQPEFLNMVLGAKTELAARKIFKKIKHIEKDMGRTHSERFGPRLIDIDLLFYGTETIKEPDLQVPHQELSERAFVLVPFCEIAPKFLHPVLGVTISELLSRVSGREDVRLYSNSRQ